MSTNEGTPIALIVEDNADVREIYVSELKRLGWESVTALLREDIEQAVRDNDFDIALLDSHFPGISLEELRAMIGEVPCVVLALDDSISGHNVLYKPFLLDDFLKKIDQVIEREGNRFRAQDVVQSRATPDLGPGVVLAVEDERIYVRFGKKPIWCHRSGLIRLKRGSVH